MELKVLKCPNCGANTTNAQNCEYCGSLLVRFVDKGIDLSKTTYTNDSATFPGLVEELKRNLMLQEKNPGEFVCTDLVTLKKDTGDKEPIGILRSGKCEWRDGKEINISNSQSGLVIVLSFDTLVEGNGNDDWSKRQMKQLEKFKKLDSFPLFTGHICNVTAYGQERYSRNYAIDFGNDAEGAARLISEILQKVDGWTLDTNFDMYTEVGDNIQKARDSWDKAHGFDDDDSSPSFMDYIGWIIFIVSVIYLLKTYVL